MGRRPGISSDETREQLLAAAMKVVTERGYDGTRVAEIAREAGVTTGAIYNHFDSKADLLTSAIRDHGPGAFTALIDAYPELPVVEIFRRLGAQLPERSHSISAPLMEIIVATRRDEDVAKALTGSVSDSETERALLIQRGQDEGEIEDTIDARALARFTTMVAFGSMVADALGLDPVGEQEWTDVIDRMLVAVRPGIDQTDPVSAATPPAPTDSGSTDPSPATSSSETHTPQGDPT